MSVFHIQVPKSADQSVEQALERIRTDFGYMPQVRVVEYERLYIIDGLDNSEIKSKLSDTLRQLNIIHF